MNADCAKSIADHESIVRNLAGSMAARYHEPADDLYGAAMLRLVRDLPRFQLKRGTLLAFVRIRARGAMFDHVRAWRHCRQVAHRRVWFEAFDERLHGAVLDGQEGAVQRRELDEWLSHLKPRYAQAMRLYWFEGWTLGEIGDLFGVNESRMSQICKRALEQLRAVALLSADERGVA